MSVETTLFEFLAAHVASVDSQSPLYGWEAKATEHEPKINLEARGTVMVSDALARGGQRADGTMGEFDWRGTLIFLSRVDTRLDTRDYAAARDRVVAAALAAQDAIEASPELVEELCEVLCDTIPRTFTNAFGHVFALSNLPVTARGRSL